MRIDAHQHFWRYTPEHYGWITDAMPILQRDYLPPDLRPLLDRAGVDGTVAVQARQDLDETLWLLDLADQHAWIKGVVGWVDLQSPQVRAQLDQIARHPKLRGIRHIVHDEPDDQFMLRPAFLHGLGLLHERNLTYDLLLFPRHLPIAAEVVHRFPQQRFVLDHIAKPHIKTHTIDPWQADLRALAKCPNVHCKLSGMVTEAAWQQWAIGDFRRYLDVVFDCFGSDRLMWGSDWPVCTLSASYAEVLVIVLDYARQLPIETQEQIFGGNAARFYGLT